MKSYRHVRETTVAFCEKLELEDYALQAMPEVSPPKWHLAHTSWFFETFILKPFADGYCAFNPHFEVLFNSYYHGVGAQYPRAQRGLLSRPTVKEVLEYREHVDVAMIEFLTQTEHPQRGVILQRCELGLHHEQQHQELLCTDIKYSFSLNPLYPAMDLEPEIVETSTLPALSFVNVSASDVLIGYQGEGFHFDNEVPVHQFHQSAFRFANRLITNEEYLAFMTDGGYNKPELWLSDGWAWKQSSNLENPLYWHRQGDAWFEYTLYGLKALSLNQPVAHVNYFEADAYARWCGKRLPTEQEWEIVSKQKQSSVTINGTSLHPVFSAEKNAVIQLFASLWQWTSSNYSAYPGYRTSEGAIGEYNGKFMCNQMVLRGSSCVTAKGHARSSYRNFFYPKDQWQFTGIRLADNV